MLVIRLLYRNAGEEPALGALIAVFRFKVGMLKVLAACSLAGLAYGLL